MRLALYVLAFALLGGAVANALFLSYGIPAALAVSVGLVWAVLRLGEAYLDWTIGGESR